MLFVNKKAGTPGGEHATRGQIPNYAILFVTILSGVGIGDYGCKVLSDRMWDVGEFPGHNHKDINDFMIFLSLLGGLVMILLIESWWGNP